MEYKAVLAARDIVYTVLGECTDENMERELNKTIALLDGVIDKLRKAANDEQLLKAAKRIVKEDYPSFGPTKVAKMARRLVRQIKKEERNVSV